MADLTLNEGNIRIEPVELFFGQMENQFNLGHTEGDIEVTVDDQLVDIFTHQGGQQLQDAIRNGKNVELSVSALQTTKTELNRLLEFSGGTLATGLAEVSSVTCVADDTSSLNDKYFYLNAANNATKYYVWMNVGAAGTDPAISGRTGVEVTFAEDATASTVATAVASAVDAIADFGAAASGAVVTITNAAVGGADDVADSATATATGFTLSVTTQGATVGSGWGDSKQFTNISNQTDRLILHPIRLADTDTSNDITFWRAYPKLDSITKSGENAQTVGITFRILIDPTRPSEINIFQLGGGL